MKYRIIPTATFKRELKKAGRRGLPLDELERVVDKLANDKPLDKKYRDHDLVGNYKGYRECHIQSDWLLIYKKKAEVMVMVLARTGTHSDLF